MLKNFPNAKYPVLVANEEPTPATLSDRVALSGMKEGRVYPARSRQGFAAIVLLRKGRVFAYEAKCPHMGSDLTVATCVGPEHHVGCPWHGYRFSIETGYVVENPNEPAMKTVRVASPNFDPDMKPPFRLRGLEVEISNGWVQVK